MKLPSLILVLIAILGISYLARVWLPSRLSTAGKTPDCLDLAGSTTAEDEGSTYIIGSVRNGCEYSFGSVTLSFKVDRPPGPMGDLPEGQAFAYVRNLKSGETRDFKTVLPISRDASYRFGGMNAF